MPATTGHSLAPPERAAPWLASGLLGQPWSSWAFALRIWLATLLALCAAFWLQLGNPSSSMITVAILALPRRGQAFSKALYRALATLIGAIAALVLTAVFAQTRDLFLVGFAAWMAFCVYVAALRDGNRAYAAVLSGYTVATLAVENIDAPLNVFNAATNSIAAISVGIVAIGVVNDVLAAPDVWDGLRPRLHAAAATASATVKAARFGPMPPVEALVPQLSALTGMRLELMMLASERAAGSRRAAAGRSAIAAILAGLAGTRMLAVLEAAGLRRDTDTVPTEPTAAAARVATAMSTAAPSVDAIVVAQLEADILGQQTLAEAELAAMDCVHPPMREIVLPIHRAWQEARRKALRVFLLLLAGSLVFAATGWPQTSLGLTTLGVLAGLGANAPDAGIFARNVVIGVPLAAVAAGLTKFALLAGADSVPALAAGLAPGVGLGCLMLGHPRVAGIGFLFLVYLGVFIAPSNPQSYDPSAYLISVCLVVAATVLFAVGLAVILPVSDRDRRRWIVAHLRDDVQEAAQGRTRLAPAQTIYLTADRIVRLANLKSGTLAARRRLLVQTLTLSFLALAAGRARQALDALDREALGIAPALAEAREALATLSPTAMGEATERLTALAPAVPTPLHPRLARAVTDLAVLSRTGAMPGSPLRHLGRTLA